MDQSKTITFYIDLPPGELVQLEHYLLRYIDKDENKYLITHETSSVSKKSHYHFVVEMDNKKYENFRDNIIKKKYNLSARKDKEGKGKQYGKVNKIRDVNAMISYCLKDEGPRRTNLGETEIEDFLRASFKKDEEKEHIQACIEGMPKLTITYSINIEQDMELEIKCRKIWIIEYFKKNNLEINWSKCNRIFDLYLLKQDISADRTYEFMRLKQRKIL